MFVYNKKEKKKSWTGRLLLVKKFCTNVVLHLEHSYRLRYYTLWMHFLTRTKNLNGVRCVGQVLRCYSLAGLGHGTLIVKNAELPEPRFESE